MNLFNVLLGSNITITFTLTMNFTFTTKVFPSCWLFPNAPVPILGVLLYSLSFLISYSFRQSWCRQPVDSFFSMPHTFVFYNPVLCLFTCSWTIPLVSQLTLLPLLIPHCCKSEFHLITSWFSSYNATDFYFVSQIQNFSF